MVSVIVPAYNAEKTIIRCIDSILQQDYEHVEIVIVNDGSKDNTLNVIQKAYGNNDRIKCIDKVNGGVSSARNVGLKNATGQYVSFVDSDDYIDSDMISCMVSAMEKDESDMAICGYRYENNGLKKKKISVPDAIIGRQEISSSFVIAFISILMHSPCNKLYRKSRIKHLFDEKKHNGEDLKFVLEYLSNTRFVSFLDREFYVIDDSNSFSLSKNNRRLMAEMKENHLIISKFLNSYHISISGEMSDYFISQLWMIFSLKSGLGLSEKLKFCKFDSEYYGFLNTLNPNKGFQKILKSVLLLKIPFLSVVFLSLVNYCAELNRKK